ncbi:tRNA (adenosine(37)-N6)-dimethylallyltransferase MiaA [Campylobacter sp. faydin G-105]|uniref:tRNA (adenosine(37)-N6)-dimethylallyltransferase MiaA n=1 Tax=Campylobacter anatolicus TaxID=2829105 RepID=UPI001B91C1C8|nr:tRNA (adenosine(37)-N6)-dimethylallyltransferase MiaA [Campylobacter anatolicus]MBR8462329.1 tRNA (adenosine(37)-N6)-dimethylallyltransferase MiaA [Campylobacter anatolicus]
MFCEFAIIGTTASGKSALALRIAQEFGGVVLSLDSLALYKLIDIASAKPSRVELESVKHFGIDEIYPDENFSVGMFFEIYKRAYAYAKNLACPLIITGGSGFYLRSLLNGLTPDVPKCEINLSNAEIYDIVLSHDPEYAYKFSQNDSYRLEKWYQIYKFSGSTPSRWLKENTQEPLIKNLKIFEILWDVNEIRERIKKRTDEMFESGLLDEAKFLFKRYDKSLNAMRSIGLKECGEFLRGEICKNGTDLNELKSLIATHTCQLAKRQRTFNRSQFSDKFIGSLSECENAVRAFISAL